MQKLFAICLCFFILNGCSTTQKRPPRDDAFQYEIDTAATATAPWHVGEIVTQGSVPNNGYMVDAYRRFWGITTKGYYVVQDFHQNNDAKFTNAYLLMRRIDVSSPNFAVGRQIDGPFSWWHPNGQQAIDALFNEGVEDGVWRWWGKNGDLLTEGRWENGHSVGIWKRSNEYGGTYEQDYGYPALASMNREKLTPKRIKQRNSD